MDVAWIGSALGALVLVAALLWLAPALDGLSPDPSYPFFSVWQSAVQPEPLESVRLLALAAPFALAGVVCCLGPRSPADHRFDWALIAVQVIGIALVVWAVLEQESGPYFPEPADYFEPLLLSTPVLVAGVLIGAGLCWLLISGPGRFDRLLGGRSPSSSGAAAWIVAVVVTILWLLPAVVTDANVASSGSLASSHIPTWANDYFAVVNGRVPLVDYGAQYAQLLPLVVAPAIDALGNSLVAFSVVATALSVLALSALYGVLGQVTRRPWVAVALYVPVVAISLVPWSALGPRSEFSGDYFGFFPGRYVLPFVLAWLCAVHVRRARPGAAVLFFVGGLAVLNNFEFGTAALIALAVALSLASPRSPLRALWALVPRALLGLAAALLTVSGLTLISAGELPDFGLLTDFTRIFVSESFGLVPMPTLGLHIPIYLTFFVACAPAGGGPPRAGTRRPRPDRDAGVRRRLRPARRLLLRRPFAALAADPVVPDLGVRGSAAELGRGTRPAVAGRRPQARRAVPPVAARRAGHDPGVRRDGRRDRHRAVALAAGRTSDRGRAARQRRAQVEAFVADRTTPERRSCSSDRRASTGSPNAPTPRTRRPGTVRSRSSPPTRSTSRSTSSTPRRGRRSFFGRAVR